MKQQAKHCKPPIIIDIVKTGKTGTKHSQTNEIEPTERTKTESIEELNKRSSRNQFEEASIPAVKIKIFARRSVAGGLWIRYVPNEATTFHPNCWPCTAVAAAQMKTNNKPAEQKSLKNHCSCPLRVLERINSSLNQIPRQRE